MTCIKTGARVLFQPYGFISPADIFSVGDCAVIRWNTNGRDYHGDVSRATHTAHLDQFDRDWHRDDLGVTVLPMGRLQAMEGNT